MWNYRIERKFIICCGTKMSWGKARCHQLTNQKYFRQWKVYLVFKRKIASLELSKVLEDKIPKWREEITNLRTKFGNKKVAEVTVNSIFGGLRGIECLVCDTSDVDPVTGVKFREKLSISDLKNVLPKPLKGKEPLPEGLLWLLMTGDIPTEAQVKSISQLLTERASLPPYVLAMIQNFPHTLHPMTQMSSVVTAMSSYSKFRKAYDIGMTKNEYWRYTLEDALDIIAKLPAIAASIYVNTYKEIKSVSNPTKDLDWIANFAKMLGYNDEKFAEMMRMFFIVYSDHGSGNVQAHTTHLVGSVLNDPYLALAAGFNGAAGPLLGSANEEGLLWLENLIREVGNEYTQQQLNQYVWKTIKSGKVVPGYGSSVLRKPDPRYLYMQEFALKHLPDDLLFKLVSDLYKVVPPILMELRKVQNPWPNADAHSGVILAYYGVKESQFYTVLFGIARSLGVLSSLVWNRAMGLPVERPKSITTKKLMKAVGARK